LFYLNRKLIARKQALERLFKNQKSKFLCIDGDIHHCLYMEFKVN